VQVTNRSGVTLNTSREAKVHIIAYEDEHVLYSGRYVRGYAVTPIASLANNATQVFTLNTADLTGVDWNNMHFVALVDYRDPRNTGGYDLLQAALATSTLTISATPGSMSFKAPVGGPAPAAQPVTLSAPSGAGWTATSTTAWLDISPGSGAIPGGLQASLDPSGLAEGVYPGKITLNAGGATLEMGVIAAIGSVNWVYLPVSLR
jgi:hypothetical protein